MRNKGIITAVGLALLMPNGIMAADMASHTSMYCEKHCRTSELRKEVKDLQGAIKKVKSEGSAAGSGKVIEMQNRAKATREHLAKHEQELKDAQAELEKTEAELQQMESK